MENIINMVQWDIAVSVAAGIFMVNAFYFAVESVKRLLAPPFMGFRSGGPYSTSREQYATGMSSKAKGVVDE